MPRRLAFLATLAGVTIGAGIEIVEGSGASLMLPIELGVAARLAFDAVWWLAGKRRRKARATNP